MAQILVLHGPNLNLLGEREPGIYGSDTLESIDGCLAERAGTAGLEVHCFQSNAESDLIGAVQRARDTGVEFVIINPAAFTHTSIALRDALAATRLPFVEVHLSNVHAREPFRHKSFFSDLAEGVICGFGAHGYDFAMQYAISRLTNPRPETD
jgi:3-dehydroquinate dehydratase-2